ncbi:3926_t:CDS:2 [Cetraspora pellucida]|uniref:3926_t:CDS:1 n=1 Tax=Cetraspora pellucida TaxID=1433469 RepID=A0A9N9BZV2_9GLOM|nr:3926_t:CDS:2 [Cetraspora pellucida]
MSSKKKTTTIKTNDTNTTLKTNNTNTTFKTNNATTTSNNTITSMTDNSNPFENYYVLQTSPNSRPSQRTSNSNHQYDSTYDLREDNDYNVDKSRPLDNFSEENLE